MIRGPRCAAGPGRVLAAAGLLMCLSLPIFPNDLQAYGNNLAATVVISGGLVWHILHPIPDTKLADAVPGALSRGIGRVTT